MATTKNQSTKARIQFAIRNHCPTDQVVNEIARRLALVEKDPGRLAPRPFGALVRKILGEMTADPKCSF